MYVFPQKWWKPGGQWWGQLHTWTCLSMQAKTGKVQPHHCCQRSAILCIWQHLHIADTLSHCEFMSKNYKPTWVYLKNKIQPLCVGKSEVGIKGCDSGRAVLSFQCVCASVKCGCCIISDGCVWRTLWLSQRRIQFALTGWETKLTQTAAGLMKSSTSLREVEKSKIKVLQRQVRESCRIGSGHRGGLTAWLQAWCQLWLGQRAGKRNDNLLVLHSHNVTNPPVEDGEQAGKLHARKTVRMMVCWRAAAWINACSPQQLKAPSEYNKAP